MDREKYFDWNKEKSIQPNSLLEQSNQMPTPLTNKRNQT
uniref:Uncharacterized protein n=1 Tax=Arundo donax TaxID=35708 RepID=A0A0A9GYG0_ARUDO